jgi:AraC-like DNA-binding protein
VKPTIRSSALRDYAALARSKGLDPIKMIHEVDLPVKCLSEPNLMLAVDRVCDLLELCAEQSACDDFGLALAKSHRLSHLGEFGLILRDQPTLGDMARASVNFSKLYNESLIFSVKEKGEYTHVYMETNVNRDVHMRQFSEFLLGSTFKICEAVFGEASKKIRVCFRHGGPKNEHEYRKFFGSNPLFNYEFNGFIYESSLIEQMNEQADPSFSQHTLGLIQALRGSSESVSSNTEDVKRIVFELLPNGQCSAEQIASCLGVDRRTVNRQLAREGQSISSVIDLVRQELSALHILQSDLPISEVAPLLGFRSASTLVNWYKKQIGKTPMQHRKEYLASL